MRITARNKRRVEGFWRVVSLLQENSRMSPVEMSGKFKIPVSTLFDTLKEVEKVFHFTIVLKDSERIVSPRDTIPVEFDYQFLIATGEEDTTPLHLHTK
jgi:predicted transcriptional regulator